MIKSHVLYRLSYRITKGTACCRCGAQHRGRWRHGQQRGWAERTKIPPAVAPPELSLFQCLDLLAGVAVAGFQCEALGKMVGDTAADKTADVAAQTPDLLHEA